MVDAQHPTVYVLGAGASWHVGYPLIATMGTELLSWMSNSDRFRETADFLKREFGNSPNIEFVITELDRRATAGEGSELSADREQRTICAHFRSDIRTALPLWFREIHQNSAAEYAAFADHVVCPGDSIITFNYDDSLERELKRADKWDIGLGYGFKIGDGERKSKVAVLKLHGSMNWLVSIGDGVTTGPFMIGADGMLGRYPHVATDDLRFLGYTDVNGTFPGGAGFPSLILPGKTKQFYYADNSGRKEHKAFFDALWAQAEVALARAKRVVVCGYGMAEADQCACKLLLGAPAKDATIAIVCGLASQDIARRFHSAGFADVSCFCAGYFGDWIKSKIESS